MINTPVPFEKMATITLDLLKEFSVASGDPNLIHLDDEVAKKMGLKGMIAHGMLIASLVTERGLRFAGPKAKLKESEFRFRAMTYRGQVVEVGGQVAASNDANPDEFILELIARDQAGEVKTTGKLTFQKG